MSRFHRISPCPECGGRMTLRWESSGIPRFWDLMFRCRRCGYHWCNAASSSRNRHVFELEIIHWNRLNNGDRELIESVEHANRKPWKSIGRKS